MEGFSSNQFSGKKHTLFVVFSFSAFLAFSPFSHAFSMDLESGGKRVGKRVEVESGSA